MKNILTKSRFKMGFECGVTSSGFGYKNKDNQEKTL